MPLTKLAVLALLLSATGCAGWESLQVTLQDPAKVSLDRAQDLAPGKSARIDEGFVSTGTTTSARYSVDAVRDADGTLSLAWSTKLPLLYGDRDRLVAPDGVVQLPARDARGVDVARADGTASIPLCAFLDASYDEGGGGYSAGHSAACGARSVSVPLRLETPWANVASITRHHEGASTAVGGVIDLALLPSAFDRDRDEVLWPR